MKRTVEVVCANSLKINRGNYEQESPLFSIKTIAEVEEGTLFDEISEYNRLKKMVDSALDEHWQKAKLSLSNVRIRVLDGKEFPSVTSILNPDPIPVVNIEEYANRGKELERLVIHWLSTKKWLIPSLPLKGITYEEIKYQEFFEKFSGNIEFPKEAIDKVEIFHKRLLYSGEIDLFGIKIDGKPCIADIKCGAWCWEQLIAYWKALDPKISQVFGLCILDLKKGNLEYLDPLSDKAQVAWERFLLKRGEFRARFGK